MKRSDLVERLLQSYRYLPDGVLDRLLGRALEGLSLALCLHRVRYATGGPEPSGTCIRAEDLDVLVGRLLSLVPPNGQPWLTLSFDDGYQDACQYIMTRHKRFSGVRWLFFLCPAKVRDRVGFRWDLQGEGVAHSNPFSGGYDVAHENSRPELKGLGDLPASRLATVEECRELARLEGVALGNHTNTHFKLTGLELSAAKSDLLASKADFEQMFGSTTHFAFPFGTPRHEFAEEHVELAQQAGYQSIWSTEPRPYLAGGSKPSGTLPRVAIFGDWPVKKSIMYLLWVASRFRVQKLRRALQTSTIYPAKAGTE